MRSAQTTVHGPGAPDPPSTGPSCVLALTGAFDTNDPIAVESPPVLVVKPTTGGDTKGDLPGSQSGDGAAGDGSSGDTKGDVTAGTPAAGQELVLKDRAAGAGH